MPEEEMQSQFVEQITELTFRTLSKNPDFDEATLVQLKELAESTGLTSFKNVVRALGTEEGK